MRKKYYCVKMDWCTDSPKTTVIAVFFEGMARLKKFSVISARYKTDSYSAKIITNSLRQVIFSVKTAKVIFTLSSSQF